MEAHPAQGTKARAFPGLEKTSERVFYKYIDHVVGLSCGDHALGRRALVGGQSVSGQSLGREIAQCARV